MELSLIIKEIRKHLSLSQEHFSEVIGLSRSNLSQIEIGRNTPSVEMLNLIAKNFHIDISVIFEMVNSEEKLLPKLLPKLLLSEKKCTPECTPAKNFDKKKFTGKFTGEFTGNAKNAQVNAQAITKSPVVISSQRDIPTFQAREVQRGGIPLIPLEAAAGILSGTEVQIMDYECEHFVIPGFKNADFMIQITGDSMLPKYESGDVVACQRLPMSTFFQWNCVYVVDSEQGILIKRVKQGSDKEHIELVSENEKYGAFELHLGDINGLGRVVGLVRFE